jgi:hypothetical protein
VMDFVPAKAINGSAMNGMTIEVLAQQLGHKDTRITMRHYAHLCPTFKQESVRRNAPFVWLCCQ